MAVSLLVALLVSVWQSREMLPPPEPRTLMDLHESGELGEVGVLEIDWGDGADEVVVAACDLENPESCESCQ